MKQVQGKSGKTYFLPTMDEVEDALDESAGFCIACGERADGVEPDARRYECESCGEDKVYGAEEFVLRGWIAS